MAVSPDGSGVYVTVRGSIKRFPIGADGRLDPAGVTSIETGGALTDAALTPDGSHLYAPSSDGRVFQFAVGAGGMLAPLVPAEAPAESGMPSALAIAPGGNNLYVAAASAVAGERRLLQYAIGSDGRLTPRIPAGLAAPHSQLRDLAVTPDGRSLYLAGADLSLFDLAADGLASPKSSPGLGLLGAAGVVVSPNQAPVARFEVGAAAAGSAVTFDGSSAADPDGSILRYDWDFGDGNVLLNGGPRVSHVYARPGTYRARLAVTDNEGASTRTVFTGGSVLGNGSPAAETFRSVEVLAAGAARRPDVTAGPAQAATPDLGETIIVEPAGGRVRVRLPGRRSFVRLETLREIPVGSVVDASRGRVLLSSVRSRRGGVQQGRFSEASVPGSSAPRGPLPDRARAAGGLRTVRNRQRDELTGEAPPSLGQRQGPLQDAWALLIRRRARHALARAGQLRRNAHGRAARPGGGAGLRPRQDDPRRGR